jgi:hypothetical protein
LDVQLIVGGLTRAKVTNLLNNKEGGKGIKIKKAIYHRQPIFLTLNLIP